VPAAKNPPKKRIADTPAQSRRPRPTATLPRSPERIEELRRRAQRHEALFDRRDTDLDERRGLHVQVLCNGFPVATGITLEENLPAENRKGGSHGPLAFGQRLRALRREKCWSHEQLARRAGLDKRHIAKLERGKRQPGLSALLALADAFKLSLDGLIGRTPPAA
jgi:DNA-binding XRE family transcriptional regulator